MKKLISAGSYGDAPESLIEAKRKQYYRAAIINKYLYYVTRLIVAICAAILPLIIKNNPDLAEIMSICIVISIAIDMVIKPKEKWARMSRNTDLLYLEMVRRKKSLDEFEKEIQIVLNAEDEEVLNLVDIRDIYRAAKKDRVS